MRRVDQDYAGAGAPCWNLFCYIPDEYNCQNSAYYKEYRLVIIMPIVIFPCFVRFKIFSRYPKFIHRSSIAFAWAGELYGKVFQLKIILVCA